MKFQFPPKNLPTQLDKNLIPPPTGGINTQTRCSIQKYGASPFRGIQSQTGRRSEYHETYQKLVFLEEDGPGSASVVVELLLVVLFVRSISLLDLFFLGAKKSFDILLK